MSWTLDETVATRAGAVAAGHSGDGPDLVLAHGWPWSSFSWHRLIPLLEPHFRLHYYDMPGFGRSGMDAEQATSLDVQGEVFADMLDHWGLDRPLVLAHDFGGAATLRAHLLHGRDYAGYILMNVVAMRPWGSAFFDHVGRHVEAFTGLPPHIHEAVVRAYIAGALVNPLPQADLDALAGPWLTEAGRTSFYRQFAQADERYTAEVEPLFGTIRCPTAIFWGVDDPWIPLARGEALHDLVPTAEFVRLDGAGHLPQLETTDAVAANTLRFFNSIST
ncbi:alpha/beta hydrolase [Acuticoccus sediminis]|uniref:Alpha/beta hydrolase n=1 Tax=Acuticoccus sediminis TaxID=2184697 RepID=A0A8B2NMS9_9HYPH|nr:alpha/beta hydrolase [Acuticoccus sediminis]RAH98158.1 alpha/beta hydrolase [Acuticoccus sediminis]